MTRESLPDQRTCPDTGQLCECRDDSLSLAHCAARVRENEIRKAAQIVADGGDVAQRQDDTDSQMFDLKWIGAKFGLYDALDRLRRLEERQIKPLPRETNPLPPVDDLLNDDPFGIANMGPLVGRCSKCGDAREEFYTCRKGGHTVPLEES